MRTTTILLGGLATLALVSCASNAELQERMDSQNDAFSNIQERMEIRQEFREERYEERYDRIMH